MRSPHQEHLLLSVDFLISRFGNPAALPDWEPLNLATPPTLPHSAIPLSLPETFLYSLIRLEQLPKLATANLLTPVTRQLVETCAVSQTENARTTLGKSPKVSIEFALAQLCAAHLHFHACALLLQTSWGMNSHVCTLDNVLLFLDRFLDRRGKAMEKKDGWENVGKYCSDALNILRKDWQSGA